MPTRPAPCASSGRPPPRPPKRSSNAAKRLPGIERNVLRSRHDDRSRIADGHEHCRHAALSRRANWRSPSVPPRPSLRGPARRRDAHQPPRRLRAGGRPRARQAALAVGSPSCAAPSIRAARARPHPAARAAAPTASARCRPRHRDSCEAHASARPPQTNVSRDPPRKLLGAGHGNHPDRAGARDVRAATGRQIEIADLDQPQRSLAHRLLAQRQPRGLLRRHESDRHLTVLPDDAIRLVHASLDVGRRHFARQVDRRRLSAPM